MTSIDDNIQRDLMIYTDDCSYQIENRIKNELNLVVVKRLDEKSWNVNDSMRIITDPRLSLAVINVIDEISLMEIGLLNFLCKPILITSKSIMEYPAVLNTVNWTDPNCNLKDTESNFIAWYKYVIMEKLK